MEDAPSGEKKRGAESDPDGTMGASSLVVDPDDIDMPPGDDDDILRSYALEWVRNVAEVSKDPVVPPTYIVLFADLLEKGWGWERLVAFNSMDIEWCDYKNYLADYFIHNVGRVPLLCGKQKPETVGQGVAAGNGDLHAAANLCIKLERKLLRNCRDDLSREDISLSDDIKKHAKHLITSQGESSVAAAGMVCIAKEASLMYYVLTTYAGFNNSDTITFGNKIRRSALNLMLYKGSKSADAVTGAMLGLATDTLLYRQCLIAEDHLSGKDGVCCHIRSRTAAVLTKLEKEVAQEAADEEKKSKLEEKRKKKSEKRKRRKLEKKLKLNGGNEIKIS